MLSSWFSKGFSPAQSSALVLATLMLCVVAVLLFLWVTDIYRLLPSWGPIRRFDHGMDEDLRVKQALIAQHAVLRDGDLEDAENKCIRYGAIGAPTWGVCESANKSVRTIHHPEHGLCKIREGFAETQRMRAECEWWGRDEPHFLAQRGCVSTPLTINEPYVTAAHRLV
mmetsp:Transcript_134457/g.389125  ORF Transcript_134457/g.389125 Transcript_134457/m.389125 type:complete len:169 (+) Transcript_134457:103-609(+)